MHRRSFLVAAAGLGTAGLAALLQAASLTERRQVTGYGELVTDSRRILDLPAGFQYQIISVQGQRMDDGLQVPGWPDGMHAFALDRQRIAILCNHELAMAQSGLSAWSGAMTDDPAVLAAAYDHTRANRVAPGGVRRLIYNLQSRKVEKQQLLLCGTLRNCSGGATPWNSWISCEESVVKAEQEGLAHDHGYCFEVPASTEDLQQARPITAMGRFNHEAAAVDPSSGVVYMTEDRGDGLFYRYLPHQKGKLSAGGVLQALALGSRSVSTGNRGETSFPLREPQAVHWVTLKDVQSPDDRLRYQGQQSGAARFIRGEGMVVEIHPKTRRTRIWIMCTSGGKLGLGQIFYYDPSINEGASNEAREPGELTLFSEPNNPSTLRNGDNLTLMPNGDLLICEDHQRIQRLIGVTRQGDYYVLASNPRAASEFTGATFSPDGTTLFVNLQQQGGTVAITGPWKQPLTY
jgi:secreted PhoX family phosphatase